MQPRIGLLSISRGESASGPQGTAQIRHALLQALPGAFFVLDATVQDDRHLVAELLRRWCDEEELDLVVTLGGALPAPGPSPQETVPEATLEVLDRLMPGLPEAMRSYAAVDAAEALLDRGVAGIRSRSLVINLPGDPDLAVLFLEGIADVLPLVLERLSPPGAGGADAAGPPPVDATQDADAASPTGLDPEEFAAFLRRKKRI